LETSAVKTGVRKRLQSTKEEVVVEVALGVGGETLEEPTLGKGGGAKLGVGVEEEE
jgi:hypothetical protein